MTDSINQITAEFKKFIDDFQPTGGVQSVGNVLEAGDGIARVSGLSDVQAQELVQFENGVMGTAFNLEKDVVGVIIMGEYNEIIEGMEVRSTNRISSVPVGDGLIGRVVNAIGHPIDGKGPLRSSGFRPVEVIAPGVIQRKDVDQPLQTGIKA
ncbi:MAG: F0F1 ATP synthase subunit alpha, partial [Anaerolineales bacterium]|nr:F0F1 ATP synthase subunit alpha [Anaerolineales bacterium]